MNRAQRRAQERHDRQENAEKTFDVLIDSEGREVRVPKRRPPSKTKAAADRVSAKRKGARAGDKRRQQAHHRRQPDWTEQRAQELNRRMRRHISTAPEGDGLVSGPLAVAAEFLAPQLAELHGLDDADHVNGIAQWLVGVWGETVHAFDPESYLAWRAECRERVEAAMRAG